MGARIGRHFLVLAKYARWTSRPGGLTGKLRYRTETANGKDSETPKGHAPYDPPAYATFSDDDVVSISKIHPDRALANASIRVLTSLASLYGASEIRIRPPRIPHTIL
jgi:hypothetical protein